MTRKTSSETTGYDLSTTGTILEINSDTLTRAGWALTATASADFVVEIQPEGSSNWYEVEAYSATSGFDGHRPIPAAFRVRIRNTATASGTADAVLGGAN